MSAVTSVFEVNLDRTDTPGRYRVQVVSSPAGEASAVTELDPDAMLRMMPALQETLLASSVPTRRLLSRGETSLQAVGGELFDGLLSSPDVAALYRASCAVAGDREENLRIVLRFGAPELAALPWEAMFDAAADSYVSRREPVVRLLPVAAVAAPLTVRAPLRVLAVVSSPRGLPALDTQKEREDLEQALAAPVHQGLVSLAWLDRATWPALQDALLSDSWHVVHFIGHGDYDVERDEGVLALEDDAGRLHRVAADHFVDLLREARPMPRLVLLNACESSVSGVTDMFSGVAGALVRGGVSAVTAMQFEISDRAAVAFCRGFYTAVARGRGVDDAVRSGRVAILGLGDGSLEWITPTLYLRGRETRLFRLEDVGGGGAPVAPVQRRPPEDEEAAPVVPTPAARAPVAHPSVASAADADPVPGPAPAGDDGGGADRLEEIWAAAKRVGWGDRPFKYQLKPLARALAPDEAVVGVVRLPFSFFQAGAAVVSEQALHLCTDNAGSAAWRELLERTPPRYRRSADWVAVPIEDVAGPLEAAGGDLRVPLTSGDRLLLSTAPGDDITRLLTGFVETARTRWGAGHADRAGRHDVVLGEAGGRPVEVMKAVREITGASLGEAKSMTSGAPAAVLAGVPFDVAAEACRRLEAAGATVSVVRSTR